MKLKAETKCSRSLNSHPRPIPSKRKNIPYLCTGLLLYCLLVLITVLVGSAQALSYFVASPARALFSINEYWFYLVYSLTLGLFFLCDLHSLATQSKDLIEVVSILLVHSYMIIISDIILLIHYFCVALKSTDWFPQKVALYSTLLFRVALCYLFTTLSQHKLTY